MKTNYIRSIVQYGYNIFKKIKHFIMPGYIPNSDDSMVTWLQNYIIKIGFYGPTFGLTAEEIAGQQSYAQLLIDQVLAANLAIAAKTKAVQDKSSQKKGSLKAIRAMIAKIKANDNFTDSVNKDMQTDATAAAFDTNNYKTTVKLSVVGNKVVITFVKGGVEGVNIYTRMKGETEWKFLGHATRNPYTDPRGLSKPGVSEIREYMVMGEYKDVEIGQQSDIVWISFGG